MIQNQVGGGNADIPTYVVKTFTTNTTDCVKVKDDQYNAHWEYRNAPKDKKNYVFMVYGAHSNYSTSDVIASCFINGVSYSATTKLSSSGSTSLLSNGVLKLYNVGSNREFVAIFW